MTVMTIVGEQTGEETYVVTATPEHGNRVKFNVGQRYYDSRGRQRLGYLVMTPSGGMLTAHRSFEKAVFEANQRAKRYVRAYSKPRKVQR